MVFHDETLERLCGIDAFVADYAAADLQALRLAGGEERIPTLAEVLRVVNGRQMLLVEIKAPHVSDVAGAARGRGARPLRGPAAVISFHAASLAWFAENRPGVLRGLDAAGASDEFIARSDMDLENLFQGQFDFARPHFLVLDMDMIGGRIANRHRAQGLPVIAWTARSADDAERDRATTATTSSSRASRRDLRGRAHGPCADRRDRARGLGRLRQKLQHMSAIPSSASISSMRWRRAARAAPSDRLGAAPPERRWARTAGSSAVMPLYLKAQSSGEYVFDWSWAEAYERAGGRYYPKLLSGVPFTPVTAPKFLVRDGADRRADAPAAAVGGALTLCDQTGASSLHVNFPLEDEWRWLVGRGPAARARTSSTTG